MDYKGYTIIPSSNHGSTVKGAKKTNSIQVRQPCGNGYLLKKSFSYPIADNDKKDLAIQKAIMFIDILTNTI